MKKIFLLCFVAAVTLLTSCGDDYWDDGPYSQTFYDTDLIGSWELISIDGGGVPTSERNYMTFSGRGRGMYYYYSGGKPYQETMNYYCEQTYYNDYYLHVSYSGGTYSSMEYWFTQGGDMLWLQWDTVQGTVRYGYQRVYDWSGW